MRAATLTVAPRMLPSASTPPPSSTRPVCTPTRTLKSGAPCCCRTSARAAARVRRCPGRRARRARRRPRCAGLGAEGGQHAVAGVLQHAAAVGLRHGGEARERAVHHRVDRLGVELLAHGGGADHVDEQHRHLLQLLCAAAAGGAAARPARAQRRQRGVDHRVAEQRALRFERGDRRGQLLRAACSWTAFRRPVAVKPRAAASHSNLVARLPTAGAAVASPTSSSVFLGRCRSPY